MPEGLLSGLQIRTEPLTKETANTRLPSQATEPPIYSAVGGGSSDNRAQGPITCGTVDGDWLLFHDKSQSRLKAREIITTVKKNAA